MKLFLTTLLCLLFTVGVHAEDSKYEKAMKKNLANMDSTNEVSTLIELSNNFERIALAEKDKWLPYYYAAMTQVLASFSDTTLSQKDVYLDKADLLLNVADSLKPDESEIYVIKGMIGQARMQVDPMNRFRKYGAESNSNLEKALLLNSANPRPEYLMGIMRFYTPQQFGGGPAAAKPIFESSLKKFNEFELEDELMPKWGKNTVENFLKQIEEQLSTAKEPKE